MGNDKLGERSEARNILPGPPAARASQAVGSVSNRTDSRKGEARPRRWIVDYPGALRTATLPGTIASRGRTRCIGHS